jgi:hypothetical protein
MASAYVSIRPAYVSRRQHTLRTSICCAWRSCLMASEGANLYDCSAVMTAAVCVCVCVCVIVNPYEKAEWGTSSSTFDI